MNANAPTASAANTNPGKTLSQPGLRRKSAPYMNEFWPMLNIRTSCCPKCSHIFLHYAKSCPECGYVTRRKKRNRTRTQALLASVLAIVTAGFFISEIPVVESVFLSSGNSRSLGADSAKPNTRKMDGTDSTRRILLHEAELGRMRTSAIYHAQ